MKKTTKKITIGFLSFSNLAVLALVFHTYFSNHKPGLRLASVQEDSIQTKIQKECADDIQALHSTETSRRSCWVSLDRSHEEASYQLTARFELIKTDNGIVIKSKENMRNTTWHATTAQFCNHCEADKYEPIDIENVFGKLIEITQTLESTAEASVSASFSQYNQANLFKRKMLRQEELCEGKWEEENKNFVSFDIEEKIQCKVDRVSRLSPRALEEEFHKNLKNELWGIASSDQLNGDYYILEDILNDLKTDSFSVQMSKNFLIRYLQWKDDFELLSSPGEQQAFLHDQGVYREIQELKKYPQYFTKDIQNLNTAIDQALNRFNQGSGNLAPISSGSTLSPQAPANNPNPQTNPSPNYDAIYKQYMNK